MSLKIVAHLQSAGYSSYKVPGQSSKVGQTTLPLNKHIFLFSRVSHEVYSVDWGCKSQDSRSNDSVKSWNLKNKNLVDIEKVKSVSLRHRVITSSQSWNETNKKVISVEILRCEEKTKKKLKKLFSWFGNMGM